MTISEYLKIVEEQIRQKSIAPELLEELQQHMETQAEAYEAEGMDPDTALLKAVEDMGDPVDAGVQLDMVHQPKMDKRLLLIILIGFLFTTGISLVGMREDFGIRHIFWPGFCLVILFTGSFSRFAEDYQKTIISSWWVAEILAVFFSFIISDAHISQSMFSFSLIGFAALCYYYRNGESRDLSKLIGYTAIACITSLLLRSLSYTYLLFLAYAAIMSVSILRGWYKISARKYLIIIWITAVGSLTIYISYLFFTQHNLDSGVNYRHYLEDADALTHLLDKGKMGILVVLLCLLLIILLLIFMITDIRGLTNQFCRIICSGILAAFIITYLQSILSLFGIGSADQIFFPFFSLGGDSERRYVYIYFMLAANFLQLHRHDRILPHKKAKTP